MANLGPFVTLFVCVCTSFKAKSPSGVQDALWQPHEMTGSGRRMYVS
jgi:hypothetical protein